MDHCAIDHAVLFVPGGDPNIRDYSGKKAKQYLRNSASTRSQRKRAPSAPELDLVESGPSCKASLTKRGSLVITHLTLQDAPDTNDTSTA